MIPTTMTATRMTTQIRMSLNNRQRVAKERKLLTVALRTLMMMDRINLRRSQIRKTKSGKMTILSKMTKRIHRIPMILKMKRRRREQLLAGRLEGSSEAGEQLIKIILNVLFCNIIKMRGTTSQLSSQRKSEGRP